MKFGPLSINIAIAVFDTSVYLEVMGKNVCVCAQSLSRVQLFATPWTAAHQSPLSMEFSRQEYWSGLHFLFQEFTRPRDLLHCGTWEKNAIYVKRKEVLASDFFKQACHQCECWQDIQKSYRICVGLSWYHRLGSISGPVYCLLCLNHQNCHQYQNTPPRGQYSSTETHLFIVVYRHQLYLFTFPGGSAGKESACNAGELRSIPGLGRSPGEGKGYPLQYSGLENSVHGVPKSWTRLSNFQLSLFTLHVQITLFRGSVIPAEPCE